MRSKSFKILFIFTVFIAVSFFIGSKDEPTPNRTATELSKGSDLTQNDGAPLKDTPAKRTFAAVEPKPTVEKNADVRLEIIEQLNEWAMNLNDVEKQKLLKLAHKDPVAFAEVANEFLTQLPFDQVEVRNLLLGQVIEASDYINRSQDLQSISEDFYRLTSKIIARELNTSEFIETDQLNSLSTYQLETLAHEGSVIERNGNYFRSSFSTKVMALSLASHNPNVTEKAEILRQLEANSLGAMDKEANESLIFIAKDLFKITQSQ